VLNLNIYVYIFLLPLYLLVQLMGIEPVLISKQYCTLSFSILLRDKAMRKAAKELQMIWEGGETGDLSQVHHDPLAIL
jgi:hypothetical protein